MSILINRFNLRMALHQQNLSPDIADMLTNKIADLLERDEPKKPLITEIIEGDIHGSCVICGRRVHLFRSDQIHGTEWFFCPHCGHRLGWSE